MVKTCIIGWSIPLVFKNVKSINVFLYLGWCGSLAAQSGHWLAIGGKARVQTGRWPEGGEEFTEGFPGRRTGDHSQRRCQRGVCECFALQYTILEMGRCQQSNQEWDFSTKQHSNVTCKM